LADPIDCYCFRVLVFGTEGDTGAELYTRIVGESGDQVRVRQ
jgi:hypothetical protein